MRGVIVCVLAVLLTMTAPARAEAPKRVALVIGNAAYQSLKPLDNPRLDATQLAALLDANGFDVVRCDGQHPGCFDLSRDGLEKALETLRDKADGADVALVFYAGHGMEGRDGNVLAPVDMEVVDCTRLALRRAVPLDELWKAVGGARKKIVILDACRNDPLAQCPVMRGSRPMSFAALTVPEFESFLLVSSTKPGQVALDGPAGTHSPYAQALLQWLQKEPTIYFPDVLSHAAKEVIEETNRANFTQVPEMLVRGELPSTCLKGEGCVGDVRAAALSDEMEALRREHVRDQELAAIARDYLAAAERDGRPLSEEEKRQELQTLKQVSDFMLEAERGRGRPFSGDERTQELQRLVDAGRALVALNTRGERALERLKAGDETEAKRLFTEDIAAQKHIVQASQASAEEARRKMAKSLRNLAAIARPKDVAEAADLYKEAANVDPADAQAWIDYGGAAKEAGRSAEAKAAYEQAEAQGRAGGNLLVQFRALLGLGYVALVQGNRGDEEQHYRTALTLAEGAFQADPGSTEWQRSLSIAQAMMGDVLINRNNLPAAMERYEASLSIAKHLVEGDPTNNKWQQDLAIAYDRVGRAQRDQGKFSDAAASSHAELAIAEQFNKVYPEDGDWLFAIWNAHTSIGMSRWMLHNLPEAIISSRSALFAAERLVEIDPNNARWQLILWTARDMEGYFLKRQGDLNGALASYKASLAVAERRSKADPRDAFWLASLANSYFAVGSIMHEQGNQADALSSYREALAIRERLAAADPNNGDRQASVGFTLNLIGDALKAEGKLVDALASYHAAFASYRAAVASQEKSEPSNTAELGLWLLHSKIGQILQDQGDLAGALAAYRAEQSVAEKMTKLKPGDEGYLELSYSSIGDALKQQGKLADALGSYRAALAIGEQRSDKGSAEQHWYVGNDLLNIASILLARNDLAGALSSYQAALSSYGELDPDKAATREDLRTARYYIGYVLQMQGDLAGALASFQAGLAVNERLASAEPGNADRQRAVWSSHLLIGDVFSDQGHLAEALASYAAAQDIAESRSKADPDDSGWKRNLAASYRSVAGVRFANGDRSGALALWRKALTVVEASAVAVEQDEIKRSGKPGTKTADALREVGWNALIARDVAKAAAAWARWSTLAPGRGPDVGRAHVLLFRNRLPEARAVYLKYKGKGTLVDGRPWEQVIANDFQALRRAGLVRPMMSEVEVALGVVPAQVNQTATAHRPGK